MKILVITTLFPNEIQQRHGIFIEKRIIELRKHFPEIQITVIAPTPHYVWPHPNYRRNIKVSEVENRNGYNVYHPKYIALPFIGMYLNFVTLWLSIKSFMRRKLININEFDFIDCHYYYPDAVATHLLNYNVKLPTMVTARGSDLQILPKYIWPRILIKWAIRHTSYNAAVSSNLKQEIQSLVPSTECEVIPNGVDQTIFYPLVNEEVIQLRAKYANIEQKVILMVGNLVELKGHSIIIPILQELKNSVLVIVGEGSERDKLIELVGSMNLSSRVFFEGNKPQEQLANYFRLADVSILASSSEGWPNVLLESIACGTPVISTNVGAAAEIIGQYAGELVSSRDTDSFLHAIVETLSRPINRLHISEHAKQFEWKTTVSKVYNIYNIESKK